MFAITGANRMVKIDTASLAVTAILPAAPNVGDIFPPSPGSLTDLSGSGLAGITTVFVNGEPVPVYTNTDSDLVFQVPWNTPIGVNATFAISGGEGTPFESSVQASVYSYNPGFLPSFSNIYSDYVLASHQDFSSLVTAASPSSTGRIHPPVGGWHGSGDHDLGDGPGGAAGWPFGVHPLSAGNASLRPRAARSRLW